MTQVCYGSYSHDSNSVGINSWTREYVSGPTGYRKCLRISIDLEFKIIRSSQIAIMAELELMKSAYSVDGYSLQFYDDSGDTLSWALDTNTAVGGVRVIKPVTHGQIMGAHGVTFLKGSVAIMAEYLEVLGQNQFLTFQETLTFTGAGRPLRVKRTPAVGLPFKQQVTTNSWYHATQSGSLSTTTPYPAPMAPLFPDAFDGTEDDTELVSPSPETIKGQPLVWHKSWSYKYSSPFPLVGFPNIY